MDQPLADTRMARVQGVASISSGSSYGQSRVSLTFADGTNLDNATSDIRDALGRITNRLPDGVDAPTIIKADSNAQAVLQLAVTSDTMPKDELTALVNDVISERLAAVPGVADVQINGSQQKAFDELPMVLRVTLVMHDLEGYTHAEIAEATSVAEGTSKSRLFDARARMRTALADFAKD